MTAEGGLLSDKAVSRADGIEQRSLDGLAETARKDPPAPGPRCGGRDRPREPPSAWHVRENGERRRGEARDPMQLIGLAGSEGTRSDPAKRGRIRPRPDGVLMRHTRRKSSEPAPAGIAGRAWRSRGGELGVTNPRASITCPFSLPQPGAPSDERWGTASVRAPPASGRPPSTRCAPSSASTDRRRGLPGRIEKPGERRRELHGPIWG